METLKHTFSGIIQLHGLGSHVPSIANEFIEKVVRIHVGGCVNRLAKRMAPSGVLHLNDTKQVTLMVVMIDNYNCTHLIVH